MKIPFCVTTPSGVVIERFVYSYLLYGSEICLIDTGVASSEQVIFDYIRRTGRKVGDIALIIQTHAHPDHIGATRTIKAETGCRIAVHAAEKAWIEDVDLQARERPVPGFASLVSGQVAVDRTLEDGDIVDLGCGLKLEVLHTPGHSRGSVSLLLLGYNELFSGDVVPVTGEIPVYEDVSELVSSIKRLRAIPGIHQLLSSWDDPSKEAEAYQRMDEGLAYLQRIHEAVIRVSGDDPSPEPLALCSRALEELGIPAAVANPLIAKSFASHLPLRDRKKIL